MKKKCVNCNKDGGTIFTIGDSLIAKCGNKEQPCDLNINFERKDKVRIDLKFFFLLNNYHLKFNKFSCLEI